jgi:hypothetical protein
MKIIDHLISIIENCAYSLSQDGAYLPESFEELLIIYLSVLRTIPLDANGNISANVQSPAKWYFSRFLVFVWNFSVLTDNRSSSHSNSAKLTRLISEWFIIYIDRVVVVSCNDLFESIADLSLPDPSTSHPNPSSTEPAEMERSFEATPLKLIVTSLIQGDAIKLNTSDSFSNIVLSTILTSYRVLMESAVARIRLAPVGLRQLVKDSVQSRKASFYRGNQLPSVSSTEERIIDAAFRSKLQNIRLLIDSALFREVESSSQSSIPYRKLRFLNSFYYLSTFQSCEELFKFCQSCNLSSDRDLLEDLVHTDFLDFSSILLYLSDDFIFLVDFIAK